MDIVQAFDNVDKLADELMGDPGIWQDWLESLKEDDLDVDVRAEIIQNLTGMMHMLTLYQKPISGSSERTVYLLEASNPEKVTRALVTMLDGDPSVNTSEVGEYKIFEVFKDDAQKPDELMSVVSSAQGFIMVGSELDIIRKFVEGGFSDKFADLEQFKLADQALAKFRPGQQNSMLQSSLLNEQVELYYELFRQNKIGELNSLTMVSSLIQQFL